jgi:hypothetical protein
MELKLESCLPGGLRKEIDSGLAIEALVPAMELETAMDSLFVCINAAMEVEGFAPACSGGRTKATAISEVMLESTWEKIDEMLGKAGRKVATDFTQRLD